jgi:hypothetical protein
LKDHLRTLERPPDAPAPAEVGPSEDLTGGITGTATHPEYGEDALTQLGLWRDDAQVVSLSVRRAFDAAAEVGAR